MARFFSAFNLFNSKNKFYKEAGLGEAKTVDAQGKCQVRSGKFEFSLVIDKGPKLQLTMSINITKLMSIASGKQHTKNVD